MKHSRTLRPAALALVIAAAALLLAACGSSSNTGSSSSASSGSAAASAGGASSATRSKFAACLKAHGVTLPARPAGARQRRPGGYGEGGTPGFFFGGGGGNGKGRSNGGAPPGGSRFSNPKFRAALQACGGGRFPQRRFTPNKAAVTKFTACVKQHGYNLPTPNFSGKGPIFPANIARDKKFQAAAMACASDLRPRGASGGGGATGPPPGSGASSGSSSD